MNTSTRLSIHRARPEDKEVVLRFSEHTWEWGDYISLVWGKWLNEPKSRLLVATKGSTPIAIIHAVMVSRDEGWLEGLRVDPDYRKMGIAGRMTRQGLKELEKFGAKVVRFITSSTNVPIHQIGSKLEFIKIATLRHYEAEAKEGEFSGVSCPLPSSSTDMIIFVEDSRTFEATGGLYSSGWRFHALTPDRIKARLKEGVVRITGETDNIGAIAFLEEGPYRNALGVAFLDGYVDALPSILSGITTEAAISGHPLVSAWLPDLPKFTEAFSKAGFKTDDEPFWLFEKIVETEEE